MGWAIRPCHFPPRDLCDSRAEGGFATHVRLLNRGLIKIPGRQREDQSSLGCAPAVGILGTLVREQSARTCLFYARPSGTRSVSRFDGQHPGRSARADEPWGDSGPLGKGVVPKPYRARKEEDDFHSYLECESGPVDC